MEQKVVNFEVVKQKIIKTDELIRMYKQVVIKSRKLEQNFEILKKERKNNLKEIKRYELEKEMLEDSLKRTRGKKMQLEEENKELLNQKLILSDDFNKQIVGAMTTIRDLQHELKFREEMSLAAENLPKGKGKNSKESIKKSKLKVNKCNCQEQKDSIQKLTFENKQLREKIDEINKDHSNIIGQLQSQLNELKDYKIASISYEEQVNTLQTEINMVRLENDKLHDQLRNAESKLQNTTDNQQEVKSDGTQAVIEEVIDTYGSPIAQDGLETIEDSQSGDEMNIIEDVFMSITEENTENLTEPLQEDIKMPDINIYDTFEEPNIEEILKEMTHCPIMLPPLSDDETVCSIHTEISVSGIIDAVVKQEVISNVNENVILEENDLPLLNCEKVEEPVQSKEMVNTIQGGYLSSLLSEINPIFDKELVNDIKGTVISEENNLPLTNSEEIDKEIVYNNIQENRLIDKESNSIKREQWDRRIINRNKQIFKKKLLLKKKHLKMWKAKKRTKKRSNSVFDALQILQQANIKFTISNESTLPSNWSNNNFLKQLFTSNLSFASDTVDNNTQSTSSVIQPDNDLINSGLSETVIQTDNNQITEKLTCIFKNCENSNMILQKFNKNTELLGFSPSNNCSSLDESKSNDIIEDDIVTSQNIPEQLVDRLAELVSQKIRDTTKNFKRKRTKSTVSDQDSFTSETEPEIERLFERHDKDVLQRNKILLKKAKGHYQASRSVSSLESCNTQSSPEEFQQSLVANKDTILNSKEDSNVDQDEDSNESFKIPSCPQILSPISSVCGSPKNKINLLCANEDVKTLNNEIEKQLNASPSFDTEEIGISQELNDKPIIKEASTVVLESKQVNVEEKLKVENPIPLQITKNISDILSNESVQNSPNSVDSGIESALTQGDSTDESCELVSKTSYIKLDNENKKTDKNYDSSNLNRKDKGKQDLPNEPEYTDRVTVNGINEDVINLLFKQDLPNEPEYTDEVIVNGINEDVINLLSKPDLPNEPEYTDQVTVNGINEDAINLLSCDPQDSGLFEFNAELPKDITETEGNYIMSGISAYDILDMIPSEELKKCDSPREVLHDNSTEGRKSMSFETSMESAVNDSFECPLSPDMLEPTTEGYIPKIIPLENSSYLEVGYNKPEADEDVIKSSKPDEKTVIKSANEHGVLRRSARKSKKTTNSLYEYEPLSKRRSNKRKRETVSKKELEDIQEDAEVTRIPDKNEVEVTDICTISEPNSSLYEYEHSNKRKSETVSKQELEDIQEDAEVTSIPDKNEVKVTDICTISEPNSSLYEYEHLSKRRSNKRKRETVSKQELEDIQEDAEVTRIPDKHEVEVTDICAVAQPNSSNCNTIEKEKKILKKRQPRPTTKLKSQILKQMRLKRLMYQNDAKVVGNQNHQIENSNVNSVKSPIDTTETKECESANERITFDPITISQKQCSKVKILQNIVIREAHSHHQVLPSSASMPLATTDVTTNNKQNAENTIPKAALDNSENRGVTTNNERNTENTTPITASGNLENRGVTTNNKQNSEITTPIAASGNSKNCGVTTNNKRKTENTTPIAASGNSENCGASNSCDILSSILSGMKKSSGITSNKPTKVSKPRISLRRSEAFERAPDLRDVLSGQVNETGKTENAAKRLRRRRVVAKKSQDCKSVPGQDDILSQIMHDMDKDRPQPVSKNNVPKKPVQLSIDDKQWRNNLLDIAEMTQNKADMETYFTNRSSYNLNVQLTTWMKKKLPAKESTLLAKLFEQSNEGQFPDEVIRAFKRLGVDTTVNVILHRLSEDINEKPDMSCYPAPLMTKTQRLFLLLMLRLEQEKLCKLLDTFLRNVEYLLFRVRCKNWILPFTRLYLGVCRLQGNINRMRMFCCEAFYYMGDLAVPLFYTVLKSWIDVMPKESDQQNFPLAKVLVQIINLKVCNIPGYNLISLRKLLLQYHGFPDQRWNCDEVFQELYQRFLREPSHSSEYAICLFFQHKTTKWVYKKINEYFKPLVYKIPAENINFKASVILMMGKMVCGFKPNTFYDETCLVELRRFFLGLIETDNVHDFIRESVFLTLARLPKKKVDTKSKKNKKPAVIKCKKKNVKSQKLKQKTVLESSNPVS